VGTEPLLSWVSATTPTNKGRIPMTKLTLEERVKVQEMLLEAIIFGPLLGERRFRQQIAQQLYLNLEAAERTGSLSPAVQQALFAHADAMAELDNLPDGLRPALRGSLPPVDFDEPKRR